MIRTYKCCGCGACAEICPNNNISMALNRKGEIIPQVGNNCIECGKCDNICTAMI